MSVSEDGVCPQMALLRQIGSDPQKNIWSIKGLEARQPETAYGPMVAKFYAAEFPTLEMGKTPWLKHVLCLKHGWETLFAAPAGSPLFKGNLCWEYG